MFFKTLLYISLTICIAGFLLRVGRWFTRRIGAGSGEIALHQRLLSPIVELCKIVCSARILLLAKAIVFDAILQTRILKTDRLRWLMHFCIFFGFTMLVLMHALDEVITVPLFPGYASTLEPYFSLRNLFGVIALAGIVIAIVRRIVIGGPFLPSRYADRYAIGIVAVIMITGFLLDGLKIISEHSFNRMVDYYMVYEQPGDLPALKAAWEKDFDVVFSEPVAAPSPALLARGRAVSEANCNRCHSQPRAAFASYPLARAIKPAGKALNAAHADFFVYYIHLIACFIMLAYLPFSKFFHLFTDPLVMAINGVTDKKRKGNPENALTRRALELDACTDCGTCSRVCSVAPIFRMIGNEAILPANKLHGIDVMHHPVAPDARELERLAEGAFICTNCGKCTEVCPTAINLQDQWDNQRAELRERGYVPPQVWIKETAAGDWGEKLKSVTSGSLQSIVKAKYRRLSDASDRFEACIQCQTCTNVCPVVAAATSPENAVDITPHKIMNLLRMGLKDLALGSRMVWDCATCYQCQENCPQRIRVTDIIYELKNLAYDRIREIGPERGVNTKSASDKKGCVL